MRPIALLLLFLFGICNTKAQIAAKSFSVKNKNTVPTVRPGEIVPDHLFRPLGMKEMKFSELRGKLVILDFWGVHCGGCIKAMPEMQALQKMFPTQVKIILVTKDDSSAVRTLFSRISRFKDISLPIVTNDKKLSKLFYHLSVPTHVWIDPAGRMIQQTSGSNTSPILIRKLLEKGSVDLPESIEFADFQYGHPLFLEGGGRQVKQMQYYSLIAKAPEGLGGLSDLITETDSQSGLPVRILRSNVPLINLYCYAYAEGKVEKSFVYDASRRVLNIDSAHIFDFPRQRELVSEWKRKYLVAYEIKVPREKASSIYEMMKQDLQRFFGYTGLFQKRKMKCFVLRAIGTVVPTKSPNLYPQWDYNGSSFKAINVDLAFVAARMQRVFSFDGIPFFNEVREQQKVDLSIENIVLNIAAAREELKKCNLELVEEERELDILVIRQTKKDDEKQELPIGR